MEKLVEMGLVKSIGISNFTAKKVAELLEFAKIKPVCNQGRKSFFSFSGGLYCVLIYLFCCIFFFSWYTGLKHLTLCYSCPIKENIFRSWPALVAYRVALLCLWLAELPCMLHTFLVLALPLPTKEYLNLVC